MPPTPICISYKFDTPLAHAGKPVLEGAKCVNVANLNRDGAHIAYQLGYFEEDSDGYELSFTPITSAALGLGGADFDAFKGGTPIAGLTREQDLICAIYEALCAHHTADGEDWRGKVRVNSQISLWAWTQAPEGAAG